MNCVDVQDRLFASDSLQIEALDADLASHVKECDACRRVLVNLSALENAATEMPAVEGSLAARQSFLARLSTTSVNLISSRPTSRRMKHWFSSAVVSAPRLALAASVFLAIGLGIWLLGSGGVPQAAASDALVDRLVDWDVRLASAHSPQERGQIFNGSAESLKQAINRDGLSGAERELVQQLFAAGTSLAKSSDPLDDAKSFAGVSDLLLDGMHAASASKDIRKLRRITQNYALVTSLGLSDELAKAVQADKSRTAKERRPQLEEMLRHDAALRLRLDQILEESPDASRKEINRALRSDLRERKLAHRANSARRSNDDD